MEDKKIREIKDNIYKELLEESYYIDVYYDIFMDEQCFETRYRFETKILAQKFMDYVNELKYVTSSEIYFEKFRRYDDKNPYRPRYSILEDAIEDFKLCLQFRNSHMRLDENNYKYASSIHMEDMKEYIICYLSRKVERLTKENEELRKSL